MMALIVCSVGALAIGYGLGYIRGFRNAYREYRGLDIKIQGKHTR